MDFSGAYKKTYGEEELTGCIVRLAEIIKKATYAYAERTSTFRIAGDEFVILVKDTDDSELRTLAEKIVADVRGAQIHNSASEISPYVTVSAGYYVGDKKEKTDIIMDRASLALHDAKEAGRGKAVSWK
jgi:diguanylate cyclase (GGDEF)-like protein